MAFRLGNYNIDEILYGVAEDYDGNLLYTVDQLNAASIEITSDSTDIVDKNGNVVRTVYKQKSGSFNATSAFLHPQLQNAASGSQIKTATSSNMITMPKVEILTAGVSAKLNTNKAGEKLGEVDDASIAVIGIYGSGANSEPLKKGDSASIDTLTYTYDATTDTITVPAAGVDAPVKYLVKYDRKVSSGIELTNTANMFPDAVKFTLFASYIDFCDDNLRPVYIVLPNFTASPETTISLNADEQEMDFSGSLGIDFCAADQTFYYMYFPDEDVVKVVQGQ